MSSDELHHKMVIYRELLCKHKIGYHIISSHKSFQVYIWVTDQGTDDTVQRGTIHALLIQFNPNKEFWVANSFCHLRFQFYSWYVGEKNIFSKLDASRENPYVQDKALVGHKSSLAM